MYRVKRGDTLIEVLLATVVLSIVMISAYTLSNRATSINQQAYERTQASHAMQQQAEYLRSARDTNTSSGGETWDSVLNRLEADAPDFDCRDVNLTEMDRPNAFYIEDTGGSYAVTDGISYDGLFYVWIEGVDSSDYVDLYIRGCWETLGGGLNQQAGFVTRLEREI